MEGLVTGRAEGQEMLMDILEIGVGDERFDAIFHGGGAAGSALGRGESVVASDFNFDGCK
jgi:hypothetical protein